MQEHELTNAIVAIACTGIFDPQIFAESICTNSASQDELLGCLSLCCDEHFQGHKWFWQLAPDTRRATLADITSAHVLESQIAQAPKPLGEDGFGGALNAILSGNEPKRPKKKSGEDETNWLNRLTQHYVDKLAASEFARLSIAVDTTFVSNIARDALDNIRLLKLDRDTQFVLPTRLFGRRKELRRLYRFLRGKAYADAPVALLTGIGGAGKSAVLAHLLDQWRGRKGAPLVIALDFDRQILRSGEPIRIMGEILRQLDALVSARQELSSQERTQLKEGLTGLRRDLSAQTVSESSHDSSTQISYVVSYVTEDLDQPWAAPLKTMQISLVMDSFEAIGPGDGAVGKVVLYFANELATLFPGLKSVISGRGVPVRQAETVERFGQNFLHIHLEGLDPDAGAEMLAARDTAGYFSSNKMRKEASELLAGQPLALIMLSKYVEELDDVTPREFLDSLEHDEGFHAEFAHAFLFSRILDRIRNKTIAKLVHPGLVLRRLNSDMIRLILARSCLEIDLTVERANELAHELEQVYWLVEPFPQQHNSSRSPFTLRHQVDVRRPMLQGLFAGPRKTEKVPATRQRKTELALRARKVASVAAQFFEKGPPRHDPAHVWWRALPARDRLVETLYYKALTGMPPPQGMDVELVSALRLVLGEDIETLPADWIKAIEFIERERTSTFPPGSSDTTSMARRQQSQKIQQTSGSGFIGGSFEEFLGFEDDLPETASLTEIGERIDLAFENAKFDGQHLENLCQRYQSQLAKSDAHLGRSRSDQPFLHPLWKCMLVRKEWPGRTEFWDQMNSNKSNSETTFLNRSLREILLPKTSERSSVASNRLEIGADSQTLKGRTLKVPNSNHPLPLLFSDGLALAATTATPDSPISLSDLISEDGKNSMGRLGHILPRPMAEKSSLTVREISTAYERPVELNYADLVNLHDHWPILANRMIRGLNPELAAPTTAILSEMSHEIVSQITLALTKLNRLWPEELRFHDSVKYREIHAPVLVETADRCGILRELCMHLAYHDVRAERLLDKYDCITEWFFGDLDFGLSRTPVV